ncbi:tolloid-like protein 1 [Ruditapes philippinarum]|uniref:tolloid-like protein 1 n=1 Tax=Ruditapes philippinarum TaxID=129788 RepID=UPI00295B0FEF|nr:tolloid-like protein 1 [Ruditapes philippinarum]
MAMFSFFIVLMLCVSLGGTSQTFGTPEYICGEEITVNPAQPGVLSSPNFPMNYPNNANCTWVLCSSNPTWKITIEFTILIIERDFNCDSWDRVTINDGRFIGPGNLGIFCGDLFCSGYQQGFYPFDKIISEGPCVTINFCSDFIITRPGFQLNYAAA